MENINELFPYVEGALTTFQLYVLLTLKQTKQDMERERKHNINAEKRREETDKELDRRLKNLEFKAAKHWSHHDYTK